MIEKQNPVNQNYADLLRDRMSKVRDAQDGVIDKALELGMPRDRLNELIADGMNKGEIPRIVRGLTFRGSGFSVFLLDGVIPPSALSVGIHEHNGRIIRRSIELSGEAMQKASEDNATFSIEMPEDLLPQTGDAPPDWDFLTKLDAHIPADGSLPPPQI